MNPKEADMNGECVALRDLDRRVAERNLVMGAAATIFSTCMFTFFGMLVLMTTDPKGLINYPLVVVILCVFAVIFIYGLCRLDSVEKYLKRGIRNEKII